MFYNYVKILNLMTLGICWSFFLQKISFKLFILFKYKDQWYLCNFDYYDGEELTVYKIDKTVNKIIK